MTKIKAECSNHQRIMSLSEFTLSEDEIDTYVDKVKDVDDIKIWMKMIMKQLVVLRYNSKNKV